MHRLTVLATLAILLVGLILFSLSDVAISIANTGVSDNEVTGSGANNASATASIRITMTRVLDE